MKMTQIAAASIALLLVAPVSFSASAAQPNAVIVKTEDELQTESLAKCISKDGAALNVMLLMDSSSSLIDGPDKNYGLSNLNPEEDPGSDPERKRLEMIGSALGLLWDLANQKGIPLNVNLKTFGAEGDKQLKEYSLDWTEIESKDFIKEVKDKADFDKSEGTDWLGGLESAQAALSSKLQDKSNCNLMIWVTDGVLSSSDKSGDLKKICNLDTGYINWFRKNQVLILGGLLEPNEFKLGKIDQERLKEKELSRIFTSVVEGTGQAPSRESLGEFTSVIDGSSFQCGSILDDYLLGTVAVGKDATELAWKFVDLVAQVRNLVALDGDSNEGSKFIVDNQTGKVEIFAKSLSKDWVLNDSRGNEICSSSDRSICKLSKAGDISTITVNIPEEFDAFGEWSFDSRGDEVKVFGSLEGENRALTLSISLDGEITDGAKKTVSVEILSSGEVFDGDGFSDVTIKVETEKSEGYINSFGGSTELSFNLGDEEIGATATLISDAGREYSLTATRAINVVDSGKFASIKCGDNSDGPCELSPLANKNDTSITEFVVLPAEQSEMSILSNFKLEITGSDNPSRDSGGYEITIKQGEKLLATKAAGEDTFTQVNQIEVSSEDEQLALSVELRYPAASLEQDGIQAVLSYDVKSGGETTSRELDLVFSTGTAKNILVIVGITLLVYLLSLLIPYLILLQSKKRSAFFFVPDDEFAYIKFPVRITLDGSIQSRLQEGDGWENLKAPHYSKLMKMETPDKPNKLDIAGLTFEISAHKWNPFAELDMSVSRLGMLLISSQGSGAGVIRPDQTTTGQSLQDQYFFTFNANDALSPVSSSTEVDENASDPFAFSSKSRIETELSVRTGDLEGELLLITQTYGNKPKLLAALIDRVVAEVSGQNVMDEIRELRESKLEELRQVQAAPAVIEPITSTAGEPKASNDDDWFNTSNNKSEKDPFDFGSTSDDFNFGSSSKDDDWKF